MNTATPQASWQAQDTPPAPDVYSDEALINVLLAAGRLNQDNLNRARALAESTGESVLLLLRRLGSVSDRNLAESLHEMLDLPILEQDQYPEMFTLESDLPEVFLRQNQIVPLSETAECLSIAMVDPRDEFALQGLYYKVGKPIEASIGLPADISAALDRLLGKTGGGEDFTTEFSDELQEEDIEQLKDLASGTPVIRMVNNMMQQAVEMRASDIHIEPFENRMKLRFRIDGVLQEIDSQPIAQAAAITSRVKIMAKLNIAERRLPQDGRIKFRVQGKELDLRVSTTPTLYGESVVMRLLDKEQVVLDFKQLGFDPELEQRFRNLLQTPHGIILVTGPTGSGKSTTLYTGLAEINTPERKIITAEDPVEYQMEGVNQIPIKPSIGLTFAHALRSIVRQDPDVIMIGEMRDLETAEIAVQSALTGHLVLSTLHTNDAPSSINRMIDMGVDDYMITTTVIGILAQRLVRRLCPNCRVAQPLDPAIVQEFGLAPWYEGKALPEQHYTAGGCEQCSYTGYRGRMSIHELMLMSEATRQSVLAKATSQELTRIARQEGMKTLLEDGMIKALQGHTSIEEVLRVTRDSV